jgi:hypothetical protein
MAVPTSFEQSNMVLSKPDTMTHEQCSALSVFGGTTGDGFPIVISYWKFTRAELDEICKTGRVWITVYGQSMQPMCVNVASPFQKGEENG